VFANASHFHPKITLASKAVVAYRVELLLGLHSNDCLASRFYARLEVTDIPKHSSLLLYGKITSVKSFLVQAHGEMNEYIFSLFLKLCPGNSFLCKDKKINGYFTTYTCGKCVTHLVHQEINLRQ
jgi:hypothetical protein